MRWHALCACQEVLRTHLLELTGPSHMVGVMMPSPILAYVDHTKGIPVPDYPRVHLSATGYHFTVVLGYPACVKRRTAALDDRYHRDAAW